MGWADNESDVTGDKDGEGKKRTPHLLNPHPSPPTFPSGAVKMLTKEEGLLGFRTRALSGVSLNLKQPRLGELGSEATQEQLLLGLGVGAFIVTGPLSCTPSGLTV